jgi:hypothetical protein
MTTKGDEAATEAIRNVGHDVVDSFKDILTPQKGKAFAVELHDSDLNETEPYARSDVLVAVPWVFHCTHTGPLLGIPATWVDLDLRGTTFVDIRDVAGNWRYFRYIDFIGALHQIGVSTDTRPALTESEFTNYENESKKKKSPS